jgi:hypothetical protein
MTPDDLESTDCTGIIKGNEDIVCEWKPPVNQETPPPLIYPIPQPRGQRLAHSTAAAC